MGGILSKTIRKPIDSKDQIRLGFHKKTDKTTRISVGVSDDCMS